MTDLDALLAGVLVQPDDDNARLVFADFLDDESDNPPCARSEFIRVQCELARMGASATRHRDCDSPRNMGELLGSPMLVHCGSCRRCELRAREWEIVENFGYAWCDGLFGADWKVDGGTKGSDSVSVRFFKGTQRHEVGVTFVRGFVGALAVSAQAWLAFADAITAAHPVTAVTLTGGQVPWNSKPLPEGDSEYYLLIGLGASLRHGKPVRLPRIGVLHSDIIKACLEAEFDGIKFTLPSANPDHSQAPGIPPGLVDTTFTVTGTWTDPASSD